MMLRQTVNGTSTAGDSALEKQTDAIACNLHDKCAVDFRAFMKSSMRLPLCDPL